MSATEVAGIVQALGGGRSGGGAIAPRPGGRADLAALERGRERRALEACLGRRGGGGLEGIGLAGPAAEDAAQDSHGATVPLRAAGEKGAQASSSARSIADLKRSKARSAWPGSAVGQRSVRSRSTSVSCAAFSVSARGACSPLPGFTVVGVPAGGGGVT